MPNLIPASSFDSVPELETSTLALGGPGGPMNLPLQALLNRTQWLHDNAAAGSSSPHATAAGTANAITATYTPPITSTVNGLKLRFTAATANTGATTFAPDAITASAILGQAGLPLQGGELAANSEVELTWSSAAGAWVMTACTDGLLQVDDGAASHHAVSKGQLDAVSAVASAAVPSADLASTATGKGAALSGFQQTGTGTAARTVSARLLDLPPSIADFTSSNFQTAATRGGTIYVPDGIFTPGTVTAGASQSYWDMGHAVDGSGNPLVVPGTMENWYQTAKMFRQSAGGAADQGVVRVDRITGYGATGTAGYENSALHVTLQTQAGNAAYETGLLSVLNNYATAGENVAAHFQSNKYATGPTWNFANEVTDWTTIADPTTGLIGIEQVIAANGTDASSNRIGLDILASRPNTAGVYSGTAAVIGYGIRLANQVADATVNKFNIGIAFKGYYVNSCIDTSTATIDAGGAAIRIGSGQLFSLTTTADRTLDYAVGSLNYRVAGTPKYQVDDTGNTNQLGVLKIGGVQILSSQSTGWSAPTGTLSRATFDASTVTLTVLAETLAALITDLRNHHGIIGA